MVTGGRGTALFLYSFAILIAAGLVAYSQTNAFAWDEGFHILTAQLILHGKKPYLDFVFSQTPLNAYWNAAWMAVFGESWRVPHALAALCSAGAVLLTGIFIRSRFPVPEWRLPGAFIALVMVGFNVLVVRYGGISQAYGLCLLTTVAAAWFGMLSVESMGFVTAALAGLFCGVAASSSLLSAPAGPILLLWILLCNRAGSGTVKFAAFLSGGAAAFIPIFLLFAQGPRQVYFGIVDYNLLYRQSDWPNATRQNLEVALTWIDSGPALVLILLAAGGLLFVHFQSDWDGPRKAEFYLCAWMSAGLALYTATAVRPTFERYFVLTVPFLSVLAVAGVFAAALRLYQAERPWPPVLFVTLLVSLGLGRALYLERDSLTWNELEQTARKVSEVTPPNAALFADEAVYFLARHAPPSGMEMWNSHKFNFPPATLAVFRLIPQAELDRRVKAGVFATLETCEDEDYIAAHGYNEIYARSAVAGDCTVFWDRKMGPR